MLDTGKRAWYDRREGGRRIMPRTKEDKYRYDQQYLHENMSNVLVTFNRKKAEDIELLEWIAAQPEKKVAYIKRLIREDMDVRKQ